MVKLTRRRLFGLAASAAALGMLGVPGTAAAQEQAAPEFAFGWEPDLPLTGVNELDFAFRDGLPARVDLTAQMPGVYNQGKIGSCVANAVAGAMQYARIMQGRPDDFEFSRMFLYYYARLMTGTQAVDTGSRIANAMEVAKLRGACKETTWTYDDHNLPDPVTHVFPQGSHGGTEPSDPARDEALDYRIIEFQRVKQSENNIRTVLASGYPVIFGFAVFSNMFVNNRPVRELNVPSASDRPVGGHAVLIVGYDDNRRMFRIRNSWGKGAHDNGYYDMSYEYVLGELSRDFWTISDTLSVVPAA